MKDILLQIISVKGMCEDKDIHCQDCPLAICRMQDRQHKGHKCIVQNVNDMDKWSQDIYERALALYLEIYCKDADLMEVLI